MPKTKEEKRTLEHFEREYKDPKKAREVYFALRNKSPKFDRSQGGGYSSKKAEGSVKESRSMYPASEAGWTESQGQGLPIVDKLTEFSHFERKKGGFNKSNLWWALRLARMPEAIKAKVTKLRPAVEWWTDRLSSLNTNLTPSDVTSEESGEDHTRV